MTDSSRSYLSVEEIEAFADTLSVLAAEAVQQANSGHPGAPLGMARFLSELMLNHARFDPAQPEWINRDRLVLSAGHASAGLYALLHLLGYPLSLDELKRFRQWGSPTPGHPEKDLRLGIETTTGPLGQGLSTAVGMALGAKHLEAEFNSPGVALIDHKVFVVASEGDIMEGISSEACSLAGHWGLDNLVVLLDRNEICIDGNTSLSFSEDIQKRFEAQRWIVDEIEGHDVSAIRTALETARQRTGSPTLIICHTHIGWRSAKQDSAGAHGEPLGQDHLDAYKKQLGVTESFAVPESVRVTGRKAREQGAVFRSAWEEIFSDYQKAHPILAEEFTRRLAGKLPTGWEESLPAFDAGVSMATRKASGAVLDSVIPALPELVGGSADLTPSNNTKAKGMSDLLPSDFGGRYIHYGIREHAMGAILNGLFLEGGIIPYGGTFLIFSDYLKPAIRLAALMKNRVIFVFTHDSIGLGEDGPTHQPIEQLAALRAIPNLHVIRPADAGETAAAWEMALTYQGPTALILSRQNLSTHGHSVSSEVVSRGGYVIREGTKKDLDLVLAATGSEVGLAIQTADELEATGKSVRVVSLPCWEVFREQSQQYQAEILPAGIRKIGIEAASPLGWREWVDEVIGISKFGASAPGEVMMERYGFTPKAVTARLNTRLSDI